MSYDDELRYTMKEDLKGLKEKIATLTSQVEDDRQAEKRRLQVMNDPIKNVTLGNELMMKHTDMCKRLYDVAPHDPLDYDGNLDLREIRDTLKQVGLAILEDKKMAAKLRKLPVEALQRLSFDTRIPTIYFDSAATMHAEDEESAALRAAPMKDLTKLNGINVGYEGRLVKGTIPVGKNNGRNSMQAWADHLPFANNSVDFIISLHSLEHVANPPEVINHYLDILRPGGGIGIILPNVDYIWPSHEDGSVWGHRWASRPETVCAMHEVFWKDRANLERLATLKNKNSFDVVLRKHGLFYPHEDDAIPTDPTGKELYKAGMFWGEAY